MFVVTMSAVSALMFSAIALNYKQAAETRHATCDATLVALNAIGDVADAGVRPVPDELAPGTPEGLRAAFLSQIAATVAENERRRKVERDVDAAAATLRSSAFCG